MAIAALLDTHIVPNKRKMCEHYLTTVENGGIQHDPRILLPGYYISGEMQHSRWPVALKHVMLIVALQPAACRWLYRVIHILCLILMHASYSLRVTFLEAGHMFPSTSCASVSKQHQLLC